jgi:UDPglucose--hexose-1-phosphate uridylyltransferase
MSELREDPITHDWVISIRKGPNARKTRARNLRSGPFCPGNEHLTPEPTDCFMDGERWSVRAVPNKFPALDTQRGLASLTEQVFTGRSRGAAARI